MTRKKSKDNVRLVPGVPGSFSMDFRELMDIKCCAKKYRDN